MMNQPFFFVNTIVKNLVLVTKVEKVVINLVTPCTKPQPSIWNCVSVILKGNKWIGDGKSKVRTRTETMHTAIAIVWMTSYHTGTTHIYFETYRVEIQTLWLIDIFKSMTIYIAPDFPLLVFSRPELQKHATLQQRVL